MDPTTTARLVLAPGLRVVRRGRDRLQVGLYDDRRAVLPRTPETEALLDSLLDRTPVGPDLPAPLHAVLDVLRRRGCVEPALGAAEAGSGATVSLSGELPGADVALLLGSAGLRRAAVGTADVALLLAAGELARGGPTGSCDSACPTSSCASSTAAPSSVPSWCRAARPACAASTPIAGWRTPST